MKNILKKIKIYYKSGELLERIISKLYRMILPYLYNLLAKSKDIKRNKIIIMTFQNDYTCNAKYIVEELLKQNKNYDIVWAVKNIDAVKNNYPAGIRLVKRKTYKFYNEVFSSKIWIDNAMNFFNEKLLKKKEQILINTWHGSMGLKRIGEGDPNNKDWVEKAHRCQKETDYCITNSLFEEEVYRNTYWPNNEHWKIGHPRNDILVNNNKNEKEKIRKNFNEKYGLVGDEKLLLYAPTFRPDHSSDNYGIDFFRLIEALELKFGGKWKILTRMHYHLKKLNRKNKIYDEQIYLIDVTEYTDIQELMLISDIGITDYSSWICDFVLTRKPAFIFASDLKEYSDTRGFYYPLSSTPFLLANNNDELIKNINDFNLDNYIKECKEFLKERGCYENGNASKQVVEKIKEIIGDVD